MSICTLNAGIEQTGGSLKTAFCRVLCDSGGFGSGAFVGGIGAGGSEGSQRIRERLEVSGSHLQCDGIERLLKGVY